MPWALLWKFRKYIALVALIGTLIGLTIQAIAKHDEAVASIAVGKYKRDVLRDELGRTQELINSYETLIDSLQKEYAKGAEKKVEVHKHAEKLVKIQSVEQGSIDSLVATVRDSAVKVVVDSVDLAYKSLVANMSEQVVTANALADMAVSDSANLHNIINAQQGEIEGYKRINLDLVKTLDTPNVNPPIKHGVGHFIIHTVLPVAATGYAVYKIGDGLVRSESRYRERTN